MSAVNLWLGVREYGGIWRHGGVDGRYEEHERLGAIGKNWMPALADALSVYGLRTAAGATLRPSWYLES